MSYIQLFQRRGARTTNHRKEDKGQYKSFFRNFMWVLNEIFPEIEYCLIHDLQ